MGSISGNNREIEMLRNRLAAQQQELQTAYRQLHRYAEDFQWLLIASREQPKPASTAASVHDAASNVDRAAPATLELGELCAQLARACGQDERYCEAIRLAARASDYWRHSSDVALSMDRDKCQAEIARFRHERFDGSGFPDRLAGERIPLSARIFALVEFVAFLASGNAAQKDVAFPKQDLQEMLQLLGDGLFDPLLAERLLPIWKRSAVAHGS
jgi:HD-GYP domain-containing protein (c-di-GMP phosphodiesterase class II)